MSTSDMYKLTLAYANHGTDIIYLDNPRMLHEMEKISVFLPSFSREDTATLGKIWNIKIKLRSKMQRQFRKTLDKEVE